MIYCASCLETDLYSCYSSKHFTSNYSQANKIKIPVVVHCGLCNVWLVFLERKRAGWKGEEQNSPQVQTGPSSKKLLHSPEPNSAHLFNPNTLSLQTLPFHPLPLQLLPLNFKSFPFPLQALFSLVHYSYPFSLAALSLGNFSSPEEKKKRGSRNSSKKFCHPKLTSP